MELIILLIVMIISIEELGKGEYLVEGVGFLGE
jgi:hypothetical protein